MLNNSLPHPSIVSLISTVTFCIYNTSVFNISSFILILSFHIHLIYIYLYTYNNIKIYAIGSSVIMLYKFPQEFVLPVYYFSSEKVVFFKCYAILFCG